MLFAGRGAQLCWARVWEGCVAVLLPIPCSWRTMFVCNTVVQIAVTDSCGGRPNSRKHCIAFRYRTKRGSNYN